MTNLLDSLNSLKEQISKIEETSITKSEEIKEETKVVDNKSILEANLAELKEIQKNKIQINVGGRLYTFSLQTLKSTVGENIFQSGEKLIFYDGSPDLFGYVSDLIRNLNIQKPADYIHKLNIRFNEDETIIKSMINEIFLKPDEEIWPRLKIVREVIAVQIVNENPIEGNNNANVNNYNNRNAAYNYNY